MAFIILFNRIKMCANNSLPTLVGMARFFHYFHSSFIFLFHFAYKRFVIIINMHKQIILCGSFYEFKSTKMTLLQRFRFPVFRWLVNIFIFRIENSLSDETEFLIFTICDSNLMVYGYSNDTWNCPFQRGKKRKHVMRWLFIRFDFESVDWAD